MGTQNTGTFCPKCGKQTVSFTQQFSPDTGAQIVVGSCSSCGNTWQVINNAPPVQQVIVQQPPKKKDHTAAKVVFITLGVVVLLSLFGSALSGNKNKSEGSTTITAATDDNTTTQDNSGGGTATPETTAAEKKSEMSYEITDTNFNYYTNSIGRIEFYGIVEITNTGNTNIYLKSCTFDLEDNDGHLLQSESTFVSSCPDVIKPGEKGYFYNGIGANYLDKEVSTDNGLKLTPQFKLEEAKKDNIVDYEVSDTALRKDDHGNAKVTGRVTNTTDKDDNLFYIEARFKDASGKVLFITGTNIMDFTAGSTVSFEISAMYADDSIDFDKIADYEIVARKSYYQF